MRFGFSYKTLCVLLLLFLCNKNFAEPLNIDYAFVVPPDFYNPYDIYVIGQGSIIGALFGGNSINIGQDSSGNVNPNIFTTQGSMSGIPTFNVYGGSSFTANDNVTGVNNSFTVNTNVDAIFNASLNGAGGTLINNGNVTINPAGSVNMSGGLTNTGTLTIFSPFTISSTSYNSGILNIGNSVTVANGFYNTGNIYVIGAGSISGSMLTASSLSVGQDSYGNLKATNTTTSTAMQSIPIVHVYNGSAITFNAALSGVSQSFTIDSGASATLNNIVSGLNGSFINNGTATVGTNGYIWTTGTFVNNGSLNVYGTINTGQAIAINGALSILGTTSTISDSITGGINSVLNVGKDSFGNMVASSFTTSNSINNIPTIHIYAGSVLTAANPIFGVKNNFTVDIAASAILNAPVTGAGIYNNNGNTTVGAGGSIDFSSGVNNLGGLYVVGTGAILNNISGSSSSNINIGQDASGNINASNFATAGIVNGVGTLHVYNGSTFTANNTISGMSNAFIIDTGANAIVNDDLSGAGIIVNNGTFTLGTTGSISIAGGIYNAGNMYCAGNDSIFSNITGGTGGNLYIVGNVIVNNTITDMPNIYVNSGAAFTINNTITSVVASNLTVNAGASAAVNAAVTGFNNISNAGNLVIAHNINSQVVNNTGTITVSGQRTITGNSFISPGVQNFSITNGTQFDSLTASNIIDLTNGGTVNINSTFVGTYETQYYWNILTAPTINMDSSTVVNTPNSTFIKSWQTNALDTVLQLAYKRVSFKSMADGDLNSQIASALDSLPIINGSHIHGPLLHAIASSPDAATYNAALHQLQPNVNANSHNVALQNATLNKVEMRIASAQNVSPHIAPGMAYGDICTDIAQWIAVFGSIANQQPFKSVYGYHATSSGGLIGVDLLVSRGDVYGLAFGISNSNVHETTNEQFITRVLGYHAIVYGSNYLYSDSFFFEWLATGVTSQNTGSRYININNTDLSVYAKYRTGQGGLRFNLGQSTGSDQFDFALIETLRYALLYQPVYYEQNSTAALQVTPNRYSNILTLGGGIRLSAHEEDVWQNGTKELRLMGTYDVVSSAQVTSANFINSVGDFAISSAPGRWAFKVGATYGVTFCDHVQLEVNYDFELRTSYTNNSGEIKLKWLF